MGDAEAGSSVELRTALHALATRLVEDARWHGRAVSWPVPQSAPDGMAPQGVSWTIQQQPTPWLYDGLAGIARGAALVAPVVAEVDAALGERLRRTAAAALDGAIVAAREIGAAARPGLYDGCMGVACTAVELGRLWRRPALEQQGRHLAGATIAALADDDSSLDLISGRAGVVCGAGWIDGWGRAADPDAWPRLLSAALLDPPEAYGPGLAHGLAGISVALAHAWRHTGDPRLLARIGALQQREDRAYSAAGGGWTDARDTTQRPAWWCHGAVGIGLARRRVAAFTGLPPDGAPQALVAVERALADGGLTHHDWSLCHGLAGAAAFLQASRPATARVAARRLLLEGAGVAAQVGWWPGGTPLAIADPGLMTGQAGVMLVLGRAIRGDASVPWPLWF